MPAAETKAAEEPKNTAHLFVFMSEEKSIVATCVLSPISARKIVTKTEKKVFQSIFELTLLFFGYGLHRGQPPSMRNRRPAESEVNQPHHLLRVARAARYARRRYLLDAPQLFRPERYPAASLACVLLKLFRCFSRLIKANAVPFQFAVVNMEARRAFRRG